MGVRRSGPVEVQSCGQNIRLPRRRHKTLAPGRASPFTFAADSRHYPVAKSAAMSKSLRANLRGTLLRGPLHASWAARRGRQLDRAYRENLLREKSPVPAITTAPALANPGALRRVLFIADCAWEPQSLIPELARLAEVRVLDLHPDLERVTVADAPEIVLRSIGAFAKQETSLAPDAVIFYARPNLLCDEVFAALRRRWKCPLLGMNLDDKLQFFPHGLLADANDDYARWARKFDLNLTSCLAATDWYRARGCAAVYLPPGFHARPEMAAPASSDFKYEFSFVGAKRHEREVFIRQLQAAGIPVKPFGRDWPGAKWIADPDEIYRGSQLNLGLGHPTPSLALANLKARDFECPGAGGCYLTTYNWELALHFELGREIICYRNFEELIELYAFYRRRPVECLKIAQAGWRRCAAEHSWEKRFRKVFTEAGFKVRPSP